MESLEKICSLLYDNKLLNEEQTILAIKVIDAQEPSEISKALKRKLNNKKRFDEYEAHLFEQLFAKEYSE